MRGQAEPRSARFGIDEINVGEAQAPLATKSEFDIPTLSGTLLKIERNVTNRRVAGQFHKLCSHNVLRVAKIVASGRPAPIAGSLRRLIAGDICERICAGSRCRLS